MSDVELKELDSLSRDELMARATALGVARPELLTRVELRDEIVRLTETDEAKRQRARGWFGVARDLVASVVEQRLNLPDAADLIRGVNVMMPKHVPPVATVTLAEIYAAQGHVKRAIKMLDEVLRGEPDHEAAQKLRHELTAQLEREDSERNSTLPEEAEPFEAPAEAELETPSAVHEEQAPGLEQAEARDVAAAVAEEQAPGLEQAEARDVAAAVAEEQAPGLEQAEARDVAAAVAEEQAPGVEQAERRDVAAAIAEERVPSVEQAERRELIAEASEAHAPANARESRSEAQMEAESVQRLERTPSASEPEVTLLIYRRSGTNVICHWSVEEAVWNDWASRGNGQWIVRVVQVMPSLTVTEPALSDVPLPGTSGEVMVTDVLPRQQIRMALGWLAGTQFTPVAIGAEVAGERADEARLTWVPMSTPMDPVPERVLVVARKHWQRLDIGGES